DDFRQYLARQDTYGKTGPGNAIRKPVAYFSAEFGFHESIPNYSGGLCILAGDHCKSASDLDLNFVAIGLLYRHGYFKQQIDKDRIQHAPRSPSANSPTRSAAYRTAIYTVWCHHSAGASTRYAAISLDESGPRTQTSLMASESSRRRARAVRARHGRPPPGRPRRSR